jgi:DNA-binding protein H-NS
MGMAGDDCLGVSAMEAAGLTSLSLHVATIDASRAQFNGAAHREGVVTFPRRDQVSVLECVSRQVKGHFLVGNQPRRSRKKFQHGTYPSGEPPFRFPTGTTFDWEELYRRGSKRSVLAMKHFGNTLDGMSIDELWDVRGEVDAILKAKLIAEKSELEQRLAKLHPAVETRARRPYPKVLPKYRNPSNRSETWAGRGKQPGWVRKLLRSGKRIDDFRIDGAAT